MVQSTIQQKMTQEDKALLLALEAKMLDDNLREMRDKFDIGNDFDFPMAEKLERYSKMAQKRLNRRYENWRRISH